MTAASLAYSIRQWGMMIILIPMFVMLQILCDEIFMYYYPKPTVEKLRVEWAATGLGLILTLLLLQAATLCHNIFRASTTVRSYVVYVIITPVLLVYQTAMVELFNVYLDPEPTTPRLVIVACWTLGVTVASLLLCVVLCSSYCEWMWKSVEVGLCYEEGHTVAKE